MKRTGIFEVDVHGMRDRARSLGLEALIRELIQNALDEKGVGLIEVSMARASEMRGHYRLSVTDDAPDGFRDLAESYTLYAPSYKRDNPEQRGRFNVGEKFVIAACEWAQIFSTTGNIRFDDNGRTNSRAHKRESGTQFIGEIRTNQDEVNSAIDALCSVIVPRGITLTVNGTQVPYREPITSVTATLPTVFPGEDGVMHRTARQTLVTLYEPLAEQPAMLYEMGLPVVETGDAFDIDVAQKVPLNQDRDNVTPNYLAAIRTVALNAAVAANELTAEHATQVWVRQAAGDKAATDEAIRTVMDLRFGRDRVSYDPSDREANSLAVSKGIAVISGGMLSSDEWAQAKRANAIQPAGQVTPSSKWSYSDDPEATPETLIRQADWRPGMVSIARHARWLAHELMGVDLNVRFVNEPIRRRAAAAYNRSWGLVFNVGRLGYAWFDRTVRDPKVNDLLIHEFAHHYEEDHLQAGYHDALSDLGARMVALALDQPECFFS